MACNLLFSWHSQEEDAVKSKMISWSAALVASLWALCAAAGPITVQFTGFTQGYQAGSIYGERNASVAAGQFQFNVLNNGGVYWDTVLKAYCIDVTTNLITGTSAQYNLVSPLSSGRIDAQQLSLISSLFDQHAGAVTTAANSAAFQLALWEIIGDPASLQLGSGPDFWSTTFNGSQGIAQSWLDGLDKSGSYSSSSYEFYVLQPSGASNQTLLTARQVAVPEPGTLGLMSAGLIACFLVQRRRVATRG
jgi:hypothetical protein